MSNHPNTARNENKTLIEHMLLNPDYAIEFTLLFFLLKTGLLRHVELGDSFSPFH